MNAVNLAYLIKWIVIFVAFAASIFLSWIISDKVPEKLYYAVDFIFYASIVGTVISFLYLIYIVCNGIFIIGIESTYDAMIEKKAYYDEQQVPYPVEIVNGILDINRRIEEIRNKESKAGYLSKYRAMNSRVCEIQLTEDSGENGRNQMEKATEEKESVAAVEEKPSDTENNGSNRIEDSMLLIPVE